MNHANDFVLKLFAPLGRDFCDYFYFLSVLNMIAFLYVVFTILFIMFTDRKRQGMLQIISLLLPTFLSYFTNRLLYSMCVGSTQQNM